MNKDSEVDTLNLGIVDRLEVIDETGRAYVNTSVGEIDFSIQDEGCTLKIFVKAEPIDQSEL